MKVLLQINLVRLMRVIKVLQRIARTGAELTAHVCLRDTIENTIENTLQNTTKYNITKYPIINRSDCPDPTL